jgi:hypothetical protein
MNFDIANDKRKMLVAVSAGILGNLLSYLSSLLTPLQPQVSFDFSHLATFITAIVLGPFYGMIAGAVGAIYPYMHYAVFGIYGPYFGLAIIFGKTMTGLICGLLRNKMPVFLVVNISYIPESLFTLGFTQMMTLLLSPEVMNAKVIYGIIIEGWVEVLIFSFLIDTIMREKIIETAVLMLEIFIIMFLVHKEFINTLLILLLITLLTMILFEMIKPFVKKIRKSD